MRKYLFAQAIIIVSLSLIMLATSFRIGKNQSETIIIESIHSPFVTGYLHENNVVTFTDINGNIIEFMLGEDHRVNVRGNNNTTHEWLPIDLPFVRGEGDEKLVVSYVDNGDTDVELFWNQSYWNSVTE